MQGLIDQRGVAISCARGSSMGGPARGSLKEHPMSQFEFAYVVFLTRTHTYIYIYIYIHRPLPLAV